MITTQKTLIVEDDAMLGDIFSRALREVDFDICLVRDGEAALDWLSEYVPDLIVLDLHLPIVSGEDVLKYVKNQPRFAHTRVMLVTADAAFGVLLDRQTDLLLIKPVDVFQLQRLAQRLKGV